MAHEVFVSYSSRDKPAADAVCAALEARGIRCWIAPRDILPGMDWSGAIIDALTASRAMVLVFSESSNRSEQVKREVVTAVGEAIVVVPFRIEDVPLSKHMRYFLGTPQWLDAFTPPLEKHLQRLGDTLQTLLMVPALRGAEPEQDPAELAESDGTEVAAPNSPSRVLEAKRAFGDLRAPLYKTTALCLQVASDAGKRNICMLSCREVRLGKHRENDVVLRVFPPSTQNDAASLRISRQHAVLRLAGNDVVWENLDCPNGTLVGNERLPAKANSPLRQGVVVRPADVMSLTCDLFYSDPSEDTARYREFEAALRPAGPPNDMPSQLAAVRLRRADGLAGLEQYVIIYRTALIGRDPGCPVLIADPSVSSYHARILHLAGAFWLERCADAAEIRVDGSLLSAGDFAPLRPGSSIRIGKISVAVAEHHQYYLDPGVGGA